jgi:hypothetical protein
MNAFKTGVKRIRPEFLDAKVYNFIKEHLKPVKLLSVCVNDDSDLILYHVKYHDGENVVGTKLSADCAVMKKVIFLQTADYPMEIVTFLSINYRDFYPKMMKISFIENTKYYKVMLENKSGENLKLIFDNNFSPLNVA